MKNMHFFIIALSSFTLLLGACSEENSDSNDDNSSTNGTVTSSNELIGVWRSNCILSDDEEFSGHATLDFNTDNVHWTITVYSDAACEKKYRTEMWTYGIEIDANDENDLDGSFITTSVTDWNYQLDDSEVVSEANNNRLCSLSSWQVGVAQVAKGPYTYDINSTSTRYVLGIPDIPQDEDISDSDYYSDVQDVSYGSFCYDSFDIDVADADEITYYSINNDTLTLTYTIYDDDGNADGQGEDVYYSVE